MGEPDRVLASWPPAKAVTPVLELRDVTKRFPGVVANDGVSLALWPGEVHVLLGENGAGKSTLIGLMSGLQQPDAGTLHVDGQPVRIGSPRRALELGIGTVYQHAMLVPSLSVVDNVALGGAWWRPPDRIGLSARIRAICEEIGINLDPAAIVETLSLGEQQQAEIVRALLRGGRVLVLDESTSMLTPKGAEELGALMRRLVAKGIAVVFITHKLDEALAYGDRLSILRLGRKVGEFTPEQRRAMTTQAASDAIVRLMFGSTQALPAAATGRRINRRAATRVFEVIALEIADPGMPVCGIDFAIGPGEIFGIAGIDGNGQKQLAEALAGQRGIASGRILLDGKSIEDSDVGERRALGVRYVTDDRLSEGTVSTLPVSTNLVLKQIGEAPFWRRGVEQPAAIAAHARALVTNYDVRTPGIATPIGKLSGGNIQKALLARELSGPARVVIFAKPTYGLDVQNILAIRRRIREAADSGIAIIVISTDIEELLDLAGRIAVMSRGRVVGITDNDAGARRRVGELMVGLSG